MWLWMKGARVGGPEGKCISTSEVIEEQLRFQLLSGMQQLSGRMSGKERVAGEFDLIKGHSDKKGFQCFQFCMDVAPLELQWCETPCCWETSCAFRTNCLASGATMPA